MHTGIDVRMRRRAALQGDLATRLRELHGIREQIHEDLPNAILVRLEHGLAVAQALPNKANSLLVSPRLDEGERSVRNVAGAADSDIHRQSAGFHLREIEHLVEE